MHGLGDIGSEDTRRFKGHYFYARGVRGSGHRKHAATIKDTSMADVANRHIDEQAESSSMASLRQSTMASASAQASNAKIQPTAQAQYWEEYSTSNPNWEWYECIRQIQLSEPDIDLLWHFLPQMRKVKRPSEVICSNARSESSQQPFKFFSQGDIGELLKRIAGVLLLYNHDQGNNYQKIRNATHPVGLDRFTKIPRAMKLARGDAGDSACLPFDPKLVADSLDKGKGMDIDNNGYLRIYLGVDKHGKPIREHAHRIVCALYLGKGFLEAKGYVLAARKNKSGSSQATTSGDVEATISGDVEATKSNGDTPLQQDRPPQDNALPEFKHLYRDRPLHHNYEVHHRCYNKWCLSPRCLSWVSHQQNCCGQSIGKHLTPSHNEQK